MGSGMLEKDGERKGGGRERGGRRREIEGERHLENSDT